VPYCTVADRDKLLDDLEKASSSENPSARSEFVAKRRAGVKARLAVRNSNASPNFLFSDMYDAACPGMQKMGGRRFPQ
jgi:hypothetical protein